MNSDSNRHGFFAGGNFIVDSVKTIDAWPEQDTLCSILDIRRSNGGGPYNLLKNLARLDPDLPLEACGRVGADPDGDWILEDCAAHGMATSQLKVVDDAPTSVTDAMTDGSSGRRTFFHARGANATLTEADFDLASSNARLFYLGYLLLLDRLDELDENGNTGAARLLRKAREAGMLAAVDCVSTPHPQWREIALAALREADVFLLNELEAGSILNREVTRENAGQAINELGTHQERGQLVLHFPAGAVVREAHSGEISSASSINFPSDQIVGSTGAGDAFATGYLYGIHEGWEVAECLRAATCVAAISLSSSTPSEGIRPIGECLELTQRHGHRSL